MFKMKCVPLADTHTHLQYSLPQHYQWLSVVRQTKSTKVHFKTQELLLASAAAYDKTG